MNTLTDQNWHELREVILNYIRDDRDNWRYKGLSEKEVEGCVDGMIHHLKRELAQESPIEPAFLEELRKLVYDVERERVIH